MTSNKYGRPVTTRSSFWTLASEWFHMHSHGYEYIHWGGEGHDCYIDTTNPAAAARWDSKSEVLQAMRHDEDVRRWVAKHPWVHVVRVKLTMTTEVSDGANVERLIREIEGE